jgi:hypothetical protein
MTTAWTPFTEWRGERNNMAKNHWDPYALHVAKEMGHQWRTRYLGTPDTPIGYSPRAVLGKLKDEGPCGAGQPTARDQHFPEFYTGAALLGRRAMTKLNDQERTAIEWHFLPARIPVKAKAHFLGWKVATYWWRLNRAMTKLAAALSSLDKLPVESLDIAA